MSFGYQFCAKMIAVYPVDVADVVVECRADIAGRGEGHFPRLRAAAAFFTQYGCPAGVTPVEVIFSEI
ncbi:hypothetical protein JCM10550A_15080 [Methanogenium cariaci]